MPAGREMAEARHWDVEKSRGLAPQPPTEEQGARIERVRKILEARGLDSLLVFGSAGSIPEPVRYLAGYVHVFPTASSFLVIPVENDPILLLDQGWHLEEAKRMSWIKDIRTFPNGSRRWLYEQMQQALAGALRDAKVERGRVGVFEVELPVVYWQALAEGLPDARFEDGKPVWEEIVATPSEYDVQMMRETVRIADAGHASAVEASHAGTPEYEVCFASYRTMASMGAEFLHGSGLSTHVNIGSYSEAISNVRPFLFTTRKLERGEMFWYDLSCSYSSYYNDCCRTISIGKPTPKQQEIYMVCADMYHAMLASVKPGVTGKDIWNTGIGVAEQAGYRDYVNHVYFGHTTGIATSVRPVVAEGETKEISPNSFLNIEPGIFVPGVGSASIENALWVTADGAESANRFSIDLHVKDE
jgi:Xaa-Pro aminopeptidase